MWRGPCWQHVEGDGSGHSQRGASGGTPSSGQPLSCFAKADSTPSGIVPWRAGPASPLAVDDVLLLLSGRPHRQGCRVHRNPRGRTTEGRCGQRCRGGAGAPSRPPTSWWICCSGNLRNGPEREELISRYERYIACARQPGLRDIQRRILQQRTDAVVEVVERSGRSVRAELVTALVCAVDGAVRGIVGGRR